MSHWFNITFNRALSAMPREILWQAGNPKSSFWLYFYYYWGTLCARVIVSSFSKCDSNKVKHVLNSRPQKWPRKLLPIKLEQLFSVEMRRKNMQPSAGRGLTSVTGGQSYPFLTTSSLCLQRSLWLRLSMFLVTQWYSGIQKAFEIKVLISEKAVRSWVVQEAWC